MRCMWKSWVKRHGVGRRSHLRRIGVICGGCDAFRRSFNATIVAGGAALWSRTGLWPHHELWAVFLGMGVVGLGFGLLFPAAAALVADSGGERHRGLAFGIFYAAYSLGVVAGAVMSGRLADAADGLTGTPYMIAAVIAVLSIPIAVTAMSRGIGAVRREGAVV